MPKKDNISMLTTDTISWILYIDKLKKFIINNDGFLFEEGLLKIKNSIETIKLQITFLNQQIDDIEWSERNSNIYTCAATSTAVVSAYIFELRGNSLQESILKSLLACGISVSIAKLIIIGLYGTKRERDLEKESISCQIKALNSELNSLYNILNQKYPILGDKYNRYVKKSSKQYKRTLSPKLNKNN